MRCAATTNAQHPVEQLTMQIVLCFKKKTAKWHMPLSFLIRETRDIFGFGLNKAVVTDVAVKNTFKKSTGYNKPYCTVLYYS